MAKINKEQIMKVNSQCHNSWRLDTQYYLFHGEKILFKNIEIDEENYLRFSLDYNSQKQVILRISKFYHEKGKDYSSTSGLGKCKILEDIPLKRKSINNLIEFTNELDNNKLLEINKDTSVASGYGMFLPSKDF